MNNDTKHRGEPVALPARKHIAGPPQPYTQRGHDIGWNACLDEIAKLGPLYQRSDAEFIALLERDRKAHCGAIHSQAGELAELRAQLAEAHALLRSLKNRPVHQWASGKIEDEIDAALSASAEPSAPKCCEPTAEELALLASGEYRPEELWGGSRPTCPKCFKAEPSAPVERDERAEVDAARYRWLKSNMTGGSIGVAGGWINADHDWDAAIDREMERKP